MTKRKKHQNWWENHLPFGTGADIRQNAKQRANGFEIFWELGSPAP